MYFDDCLVFEISLGIDVHQTNTMDTGFYNLVILKMYCVIAVPPTYLLLLSELSVLGQFQFQFR